MIAPGSGVFFLFFFFWGGGGFTLAFEGGHGGGPKDRRCWRTSPPFTRTHENRPGGSRETPLTPKHWRQFRPIALMGPLVEGIRYRPGHEAPQPNRPSGLRDHCSSFGARLNKGNQLARQQRHLSRDCTTFIILNCTIKSAFPHPRRWNLWTPPSASPHTQSAVSRFMLTLTKVQSRHLFARQQKPPAVSNLRPFVVQFCSPCVLRHGLCEDNADIRRLRNQIEKCVKLSPSHTHPSLPCSHLFPPSSVFTSATRSLSPHPLPPLYLAHSFNLSPPPHTHSSLLPRSFTHSFPTPYLLL